MPRIFHDADIEWRMRVIAPPLRPADVAYGPIRANRISGAPQGFDVNRIGTPPIRFEALALVCVYQAAESDKIFILLFLKGQKRPYQCDANRIVFSDFAGARATGLKASLRQFIHYASQHHPVLRLDRRTAEFIRGRPPAILEIDLTRFTTTMAKALESMAAPPAASI